MDVKGLSGYFPGDNDNKVDSFKYSQAWQAAHSLTQLSEFPPLISQERQPHTSDALTIAGYHSQHNSYSQSLAGETTRARREVNAASVPNPMQYLAKGRRKQVPRKLDHQVIQLSDDETPHPSPLNQHQPANRTMPALQNTRKPPAISCRYLPKAPDYGENNSSLPDSTCPEVDQAVQKPIRSFELQEVVAKIGVIKQPSKGILPLTGSDLSSKMTASGDAFWMPEIKRSPSDDDVSVKCESFYALSPGRASEVDEPRTLLVDSSHEARENKSFHEVNSLRNTEELGAAGSNFLEATSFNKKETHDEIPLDNQQTTGRFQCPHCSFTSVHRLALSIHSIIHDTKPPYQCTYCGIAHFDTPHKLNLHIEHHMEENKCCCSYRCVYARNHRGNMISPNRHRQDRLVPSNVAVSCQTGSEKSKFECATCSFSSAHQEAVALHSVVHKGPPPYACSRCQEANFETAKLLSIHAARHFDEVRYVCGYKECFYLTNNLSDMESHCVLKHDVHVGVNRAVVDDIKSVLIVNGPSDHIISRDDPYSMSYNPELRPHRKHSKLFHQKSYQCKKCRFSTLSARALRLHQLKHVDRYECTICSRKTYSKEVMRRHYLSVHKQSAPSSLCSGRSRSLSAREQLCSLCGYEGTPEEMARHKQELHTIKKCPSCSYSTIDKVLYDNHLQEHTAGSMRQDSEDDGEFRCDHCNFRCQLLTDWKAHDCHSATAIPSVDSLSCLEKLVYNPHTYPSLDPSQTFSCRKCQLNFSDPCEYQRHRRCHDKFLCDQCDFSCQRQSYLLSHLLLSHQVNSWELDKSGLCKPTASSKSDLGSLQASGQQQASGSSNTKHGLVERASPKPPSDPEASAISRLALMQEAVNNLCTSQPNPSRHAVTQQRDQATFSCHLCYFSTHSEDDLSQHFKTNHRIRCASPLVDKLSKVTAAATDTSVSGSYGERLVNILKQCSEETDWLGYDKDDSMFATPPDSSPERVSNNSSYNRSHNALPSRSSNTYKHPYIGHTDMYRQAADIRRRNLARDRPLHPNAVGAARYSAPENRIFNHLPVLTPSSKHRPVRKQSSLETQLTGSRDKIQCQFADVEKQQTGSMTMGTIDPSLIEIVSDSDDSMDS